MKIIFIIFFLFILLSEGLALPLGRVISFYLIPIFSLVYLFICYKINKKIIYPKKISSLFLLFLVFSAISAGLSSNIEFSFFGFIIYFFLFLVFITSYNYSEQLLEILPKLILSVSIIFIAYSILLPYLTIYYPYLLTFSGYQFIYSAFGSHNHLGDLLILAFIISVYYLIKLKKKTYFILSLFFLYFILFAFSRTAYLGLMVALFFLLFYFLKTKVVKLSSFTSLYLLSVVFVLLLFFVAVIQESKNLPVLRNLNEVIEKQNFLAPKHTTANRPYYFKEAFQIFLNNPFFGVGPSNLSITYKKDPEKNNWTYTSHNIFLDILSERGIFAFASFFILILTFIILSLKKLSLVSFLFLSLILMFQTDYIYLFYSLSFLFFMLAGIISKNKKDLLV